MQQRPVPRSRKTSSADSDRRDAVQSLCRALSILQALSQSDEGLTLTELSRTAGLPPSTTHRLLTTLHGQRFVRFEHRSKLWQVGVQAFVVGNAFVRTLDLVAIARPYMRRLMEDSGETVNLWTTKRFFARIADVTESDSTAGNARHGSSNPFQSREEIMKSLLPIAAAAVAALLGTTGIAKADDVLTTLGAMHVSGWQGDCL